MIDPVSDDCPPLPAPAGTEDEEALRRLGRGLLAASDEVMERIVDRVRASGRVLDLEIEGRFRRVGEVSTVAVGRWMAGEGEEVAREIGRESWRIFGQLGAERDAPLNELTKRCLCWRDAATAVVLRLADEHDVPVRVRSAAVGMLQRSLDVTLVRMCETFESERRRAQAELDRRQQELAFLATHDALTELPNRTLIVDRIEQTLRRSRRLRTPVAALFVDLDNFKGINDSLGHVAGDELLQAVAARLQAVVRDGDTLGRLGGDEFVVVAEGVSLAAGPELIAERLLDALDEPFRLPGFADVPLTVTASIGVASGDRVSAAELLRDADIALYRAKSEGRNRLAVFEPAMQDSLRRRMELEMDLRFALERDEFFLVYQPTYDLSSVAVTGVEALIRWASPARGLVGPDDFVPVLEETGLIVEVGRWVLERACAQGAAWEREGRGIEVSVNVSARQLDGDDLVDSVREALERSGFRAEALTLEVTETAIMRNAEETARRLAAVKELGVRIAIDDFGTGYTSLAHLQRFPVDTLKIDRSFVAALAHSREGEELVRTLVHLGKALALRTHAEGIELPQQLAILQEQDCEGGQGFLFAHPLDAAEVASLLDARGQEPRRALPSAT